MTISIRSIVAAGLLLAGIVFSGCEDARFGAREKGALAGAGLGAGLGAIVGNQTGNAGAGVAIGSAFGAVAGGLIGQGIDNQNDALDERERRIADQDRQIAENRRLIQELKASGVEARSTSRGVVANLPDVLFEFDSARLTPEAVHVVGDIGRVIANTSGRRVSVEGHTDAVGTAAYNQRLSEARARAVASELSMQGVSRNRMSVTGYGKTRPIASNDTEAGRARNRRVEVVIENR